MPPLCITAPCAWYAQVKDPATSRMWGVSGSDSGIKTRTTSSTSNPNESSSRPFHEVTNLVYVLIHSMRKLSQAQIRKICTLAVTGNNCSRTSIRQGSSWEVKVIGDDRVGAVKQGHICEGYCGSWRVIASEVSFWVTDLTQKRFQNCLRAPQSQQTRQGRSNMSVSEPISVAFCQTRPPIVTEMVV